MQKSALLGSAHILRKVLKSEVSSRDLRETEEEDSETEDPDSATEVSTTPTLTENAALAAVFKKTRKNVKKRLGDRLPQRGGSDPGPPARKATRPALGTSRKAGPK